MSEGFDRQTRRVALHVALAVASSVLVMVFVNLLSSPQLVFKISMASAYGSLVLLALSLIIGPWNVIRRRPNPVSGYFRRDIGIWAGILALVHVVAGLQVHMGGRIWLYFIPAAEENSILPIRLNPFGLTNYAGLLATGIFLMLLFLSNNASLRRLGAARWKSLQRWNYAAAVLVFLHGWTYQFVEKRNPGFVLVFTIVIFVVLFFQFVGFRRHGRA